MPDPPVTLRDVAVRAGVHPATASRALNPETRILVSEDTARRVLDAAARARLQPEPGGQEPADPALAHGRRADPGPEQPAVPADRARPGGPAGRGRLRGADRQHRLRRPARAHGVRPDAGPARGRPGAGHRAAAPSAAGRGVPGRPAGRADQPAGAGLQLSLGLGRQRARRADGRRPPGRARAPPHRPHRRPAGDVHRAQPVPGVRHRHGVQRPAGRQRPGRVRQVVHGRGGAAVQPRCCWTGAPGAPPSPPATTCSPSAATRRWTRPG